MLEDCMKDCIKEIWRIHEVILCQNMLHLYIKIEFGRPKFTQPEAVTPCRAGLPFSIVWHGCKGAGNIFIFLKLYLLTSVSSLMCVFMPFSPSWAAPFFKKVF